MPISASTVYGSSGRTISRAAFTPPPYPIQIVNGALVGISGAVSPSGQISGSGTNRLGNRSSSAVNCEDGREAAI